jgi:hypothetical protein
MDLIAKDRRSNQRYGIRIQIHFRVSQRGATSRWGSGTTGDFSSHGVRFRCRKLLPVGAHIEMVIDWPAKQEGVRPINLHATGFIVRSTGSEAAVRMNSCRFQINDAVWQPMGALA